MILYLILYSDDSFILDKNVDKHFNVRAKMFLCYVNKIELGNIPYSTINEWWHGNNWSKKSKQ